MNSNVTHARVRPRHLALLAAFGMMWGCTRGGGHSDDSLYAHGRIHVDAETAARWDSGEADIAAQAEKLHPIPADDHNSSLVPFSGDAKAMLLALQPSERHGASDKRMLSMLGENAAKGRVFQSSGIVAQITLVKGSEYKSEAHFRKGWLPIAIVVLPDTFPAGAVVYPKLALRGGTSWIFVREVSRSKWLASLVRFADGKVEQDSLGISVASDDKVEPVLGARFVWEDDDESIWGYCAGGCCKIRAVAR